MDIRTFSGIHAFHTTAFSDPDAGIGRAGHADWLTELIESGQCPRCGGPLPMLPELPAGSRITQCRSIPICGPCGGDEVYEQLDGAGGIGCGLSSAGVWPISEYDISERRARYIANAKPAIITDGHLLTDDSAGPMINPCDTGGWAQYGTAEEVV